MEFNSKAKKIKDFFQEKKMLFAQQEDLVKKR
jgi:hypothetical protein